MSHITLMINFARSGGTILNRCLGVLPNTVVLSEVSSYGGGRGATEDSPRTVQGQALKWYGISLKSHDFEGGIEELSNCCEASGKNLVVRDWTYASFSPIFENDHNPPYRLSTLDVLSARVSVKPFAFIRDAIDVWISRGMPDTERFFSNYLLFTEQIVAAKMPVFKYEDFCEDPSFEMRKICKETDLRYSEDFITRYKSFSSVSGDVQIRSRGVAQGEIRPLRRRLIFSRRRIREMESNDSMRRANELLGYPVRYASRNRESVLAVGMRYLSRKIRG